MSYRQGLINWLFFFIIGWFHIPHPPDSGSNFSCQDTINSYCFFSCFESWCKGHQLCSKENPFGWWLLFHDISFKDGPFSLFLSNRSLKTSFQFFLIQNSLLFLFSRFCPSICCYTVQPLFFVKVAWTTPNFSQHGYIIRMCKFWSMRLNQLGWALIFHLIMMSWFKT